MFEKPFRNREENIVAIFHADFSIPYSGRFYGHAVCKTNNLERVNAKLYMDILTGSLKIQTSIFVEFNFQWKKTRRPKQIQ